MDLRIQIRESTRDLHDQLSEQYPFKDLMVCEGKSEVVLDYLFCLKTVFLEFLNRKEMTSEFYKDCKKIFLEVKGPQIVETLGWQESQSEFVQMLAQEYLFLGSRMGIEVIVKANPGLLQSSGGRFFEMGFPTKEWRECFLQMGKLESEEDKRAFIEFVSQGYTQLFQVAKICHAENSERDGHGVIL